MAQEDPKRPQEWTLTSFQILYNPLIISAYQIIKYLSTGLDPKINRIQYASRGFGLGVPGGIHHPLRLPSVCHPASIAEPSPNFCFRRWIWALNRLDVEDGAPGFHSPWEINSSHSSASSTKHHHSSLKILKIHAFLFPDILNCRFAGRSFPPFYGTSMKILTHPHQRPPTALRLLGAT